MKVYKIRYEDECSGSGATALWVASKKEAKRQATILKKQGWRDIEYQAVDISTDKKGLLDDLNQHAAIY